MHFGSYAQDAKYDKKHKVYEQALRWEIWWSDGLDKLRGKLLDSDSWYKEAKHLYSTDVGRVEK